MEKKEQREFNFYINRFEKDFKLLCEKCKNSEELFITVEKIQEILHYCMNSKLAEFDTIEQQIFKNLVAREILMTVRG